MSPGSLEVPERAQFLRVPNALWPARMAITQSAFPAKMRRKRGAVSERIQEGIASRRSL